ncbi:flagellar motor protein MotB [Lacihabitans sp. LS3-19]|uniref:OmpA family protein n=1 Tax=Lacihabitans sp. LS3-19 TaxID=2487335 RepID=UPI0020CDFF6B|nr:OmpA family protein [Lacihabitans sp. LS3-19]MCP9770826.1 flagellar motor protein MotB [Lacihabitans sp. LS3-19]
MTIKTIIIFLFCSISIIAQDKKTLMYFEKGKKDFLERKYDSALNNFEKYFEKDSSKLEAYFRVGQIYESLRNVKMASEYYTKVIEKDTVGVTYVQAYTYLGTRALENHHFEEAKKYLNVSLANTNKNSIVFKQIQKQLKTCEFGIQAIAHPLNIKPEPLVDVLNFKSKQYFPVLTADNSTIIFTARNDLEDENIYISENKNDTWSTPASISKDINTPFNEGTCSISADGHIMVFTSCEGRDSFGSCDLFITKKEGDKWSKPENLGANINSKFWDSQPSLSSDGSKLFFSSERPLGIGRKDIWMSELDESGNWKKATNLGPNINTSYDEVSPFIHANGYSLFFSSNGKEGMGKFDIYLTTVKNGITAEAINLGYPINTSDDELSLFISADGKTAFYSVDKNNKVDLYQFSIPVELSDKIDRTHYLKGFVLDQKTQKPLYSTIELVDTKTGNKISKFLSDPITGDYMAILPGDGEYVLYIETPNYFFKSIKFDFTKKTEENRLDILLTKIEKQTKEVLQNIFFDSGSAVLREESNIELKKLKDLLDKNKTLKVEISGHTDDVGNDQTNLELSKKRAFSVVEYLIKSGINAERIIPIGYGETQPKVKNDTDENRQLNRRIEIKFL